MREFTPKLSSKPQLYVDVTNQVTSHKTWKQILLYWEPDRVNSILISIKPQFVEAIVSGVKKFELRRRFAKSVAENTRILIYSSSPVSALVAYATIAGIRKNSPNTIWRQLKNEIGISKSELDAYFEGVSQGFAIELDAVVWLLKPIGLKELKTDFGLRPPQSYRYVDELLSLKLIGQHEENTSGHQYLSSARRQQSGARSLFDTAA